MSHSKIVYAKVTVKYDILGICDKKEIYVRYSNSTVKVWRDCVPSSVTDFIRKARCIRQFMDLNYEVTEYVV